MTDQQDFSFRSFDFLWLALSLLILLVIAALLPLTPQDYWWYLRLGQDVAQSGSVPVVDLYSYTRAGMPYFYQSWLSALVFWKVHATGGLFLTFFLRLVVIGITYGGLWLFIRRLGAAARLASLMVLLAGLAGSSNWAFRPQLLTYPLFVLALYILWRWQKSWWRGVWLLPLIMVLWVNLHGSFPLLLLLQFTTLAFGSGDRKKLLVVVGASCAALLVNPHGTGVAWYVNNMLGSPSNRYSLEWLATTNRGWQANLFYLWLLLFAPLAAFFGRRISILEWVWFVLLGWLALYGVRYVIWFSFIMAVNSAGLLAEWSRDHFEHPLRQENPVPNLILGCVLLLLPFTLLPGVRESWWPDAPDPYHGANPVEAVGWLSAHPEIPGPLWSDFSHSSYIIYALPTRPVWIDTRFELYPPEQWDRYIAIANADPDWQPLLDEEGINLVMLSSGGEPALIKAMRASDHWCERFSDRDAHIFSRRLAGEACELE